MAYQEVVSLDADVTISLGGVNKRTGKKNPTEIEGYYLGKRSVADKKKKSGTSYIYFFQTPKGNVGVWGKTDLDRKMGSIAPGSMTLIKVAGMVATPNGDMYKFKVAQDPDNTITVGSDLEEGYQAEAAEDTSNEEEFQDGFEEDAALPPVFTHGSLPSSAKAKVAELLARSKKI